MFVFSRGMRNKMAMAVQGHGWLYDIVVESELPGLAY
jgi:hypothetical protein